MPYEGVEPEVMGLEGCHLRGVAGGGGAGGVWLDGVEPEGVWLEGCGWRGGA